MEKGILKEGRKNENDIGHRMRRGKRGKEKKI
jgi:hypothetical protein